MSEIDDGKKITVDDAGTSWIRMCFKSNKVWVAVDEKKSPIEKKGKVRIKYNLKQDYEYWAKTENLEPESNAIPSSKKGGKKKGATSRKLNFETSQSTHSKSDSSAKNPGDSRSSSENSASSEINSPIPDNAITIFTDGASSGNPGPAGIGVYLCHGGHKKEISEYIGHSTNNIAELCAIKRALSQLKRHDLPVRLFTDSSYSLGVLTKGWKASKNKELVAEIKALIQQFSDLQLIKIKGHAGFEGNEKADKLATDAIRHRSNRFT